MLQRIVGHRIETSTTEAKLVKVQKLKYMTKYHYGPTIRTEKQVAILECGHTVGMDEAGTKKRMKCWKCDYAAAEATT